MGAGPRGNLGPDSAHTGTELESELDLTALVDRYSRHLKQGGWSQLDAGQSGLSAWSRWTLRHERDEGQRGLFVTWRPDLLHRYILQMQAERVTES
jgi:hypothetical protein